MSTLGAQGDRDQQDIAIYYRSRPGSREEQDAFERIVRPWADRLRKACSDPDCDDVIQQVWLRVIRSKSHTTPYDPDRAPFAAWMYTLLASAILDKAQVARHRRALYEKLARQPSPLLVADSEMEVDLMAMLRSLPPAHRAAIVLPLYGFSIAEVAAGLGVSNNVISARRSRALRKLRASLDRRGCRRCGSAPLSQDVRSRATG